MTIAARRVKMNASVSFTCGCSGYRVDEPSKQPYNYRDTAVMTPIWFALTVLCENNPSGNGCLFVLGERKERVGFLDHKIPCNIDPLVEALEEAFAQ